MFKYLGNYSTMHRNAAVLTILCILLCLTFNYTFPLHREGSKWFMDAYPNHSRICIKADHHHSNILERSKKMANNIENALRRFKDSTQDISKNIQTHFNSARNSLSEEDLRQYEQLVIMKKYPYLDLKEIELYGPSEKKIRQSVKYDSGNNYAGDPSFCEPLEDSPNVEITNRGLTGFAIPAKIIKTTKLMEVKSTLKNTHKDLDDVASKHSIKLAVPLPSDVLGSLDDDIVHYEEKKLK